MPDWSQDGRFLLYIKSDYRRTLTVEIMLRDFYNNETIELLSCNYYSLVKAKFSPDGNWIVFPIISPETNISVLWFMSREIGKPIKLIEYDQKAMKMGYMVLTRVKMENGHILFSLSCYSAMRHAW
ncbi:MAG: hypothetical protein ACUVWP_07790 [bacterium]